MNGFYYKIAFAALCLAASVAFYLNKSGDSGFIASGMAGSAAGGGSAPVKGFASDGGLGTTRIDSDPKSGESFASDGGLGTTRIDGPVTEPAK